jgi:hypothetical protein
MKVNLRLLPARACVLALTAAGALALSACEPDRVQPPALIVDNGDGSATFEVPICAGDDLRDIAVSEDPQDATRGGNLDFHGIESVRTVDGVVAFDLGPALLDAKSAGGLATSGGTAFRKRPLTYRDLGMVWVTTGKTAAWIQIAGIPDGPGNAWLVHGDVSHPTGSPTTHAEGETAINSWCAGQRASASGK